MLLSAPTVLRVEIRKYDSWYCQALGVLPVRAMNAWSSPPQPGMCHWLGVECWKTLSDRNFSFICVHIKKKGNFGSLHITEIFHCLDLVFRSLEAEWWLEKLCCRVEAFLCFCLISCAKWLLLHPLRSGKWGWEEGPASLARCQSSRWEKQFTEAALWEKCRTQFDLSS